MPGRDQGHRVRLYTSRRCFRHSHRDSGAIRDRVRSGLMLRASYDQRLEVEAERNRQIARAGELTPPNPPSRPARALGGRRHSRTRVVALPHPCGGGKTVSGKAAGVAGAAGGVVQCSPGESLARFQRTRGSFKVSFDGVPTRSAMRRSWARDQSRDAEPLVTDL